MTDCTPHPGTIDSHGYGVVKVDGKMVKAHRLAYEEAHGAIPSGHVIDHLCFNRRCVNPAHLRAVPVEQNAARKSPEAQLSVTLKLRAYHAARRANRSVCKHGHPWRLESVRQADGRHYCRACKREQARARRARLRQEAAR